MNGIVTDYLIISLLSDYINTVIYQGNFLELISPHDIDVHALAAQQLAALKNAMNCLMGEYDVYFLFVMYLVIFTDLSITKYWSFLVPSVERIVYFVLSEEAAEGEDVVQAALRQQEQVCLYSW